MRASVLLLAAMSVGCQLEKLNKKAVGNGVARLTIRDAAVLTAVLAEDSRCGFKSAAALQRAKVEGTTGQPGKVTWTVTDCTLDFGAEWQLLSTDCTDIEIKAKGAATVSATRTVEGILTGSPANPVVPTKPDATTVTHTATLNGFAASKSDSDASLKLISGKLSWSAHPRLAISKSKAVCAVPTSELGLSAVRFENATGFVDSASRAFHVEIDASDLSAQLGKWGDRENALEGTVSVWGGVVTFPQDLDSPGLDPNYEAQAFVDSYTCKPDLLTPVSRECPHFSDRLAQGAAQLTVSAFGTIGSAVDDDTRCGFAAPSTLATARIVEGQVGGIGAVTFTLPAPCVLDYATKTAIRTDCHMVARELTGRVSVTGTKTVRGRLTGDPASPVIPNARDAGKLVITATFNGLKASDSASASALTLASGTLSGELGSRLAIDTATGACSIKTPVVYFRGLSWSGGAATLHSDGAEYPIQLSQSRLDAQAGAREDHTNWLQGEITVDGTKRMIPVSGMPVLDPAFDAASHVASYTCMPNLRVPQSDADCSFEEVLAKNVARLVVQTAGAVASMINKDTSCGFDATLNKLNPVEVIGDSGEMGSMKWAVNDCALRPSGEVTIDTGCTGGRRIVSGRADVTGTRKVVGERETQLLLVRSIIPRTRDAVTLDLTTIALTGFAAWSIPPGMTVPAGKLTIHAGELQTLMKPIIGELASDPGRFGIPTPVATFERISLRGASATLESGPKRFELDLREVTLAAQAGTFRGKSNVVSGTVKIGTSTVTVPEMPLDPAFMQAAFDMSYACTPDLRAVVPPN